MTNLNSLYQDEILAFARQLREAAPLDHANASASVVNPTCGDQVMLEMEISDHQISAISARVQGCAICEASTGFALHALNGMDIEKTKELPQKITDFLNGKIDMPLENGQAFLAIRDFKSRHSCIKLVYDAAAKAIMSKE